MTEFEKTYQNYNPRQAALDEARALLTAAAKAAMAARATSCTVFKTGVKTEASAVKRFSEGAFGITRAWPLVCGITSRNANVSSFS